MIDDDYKELIEDQEFPKYRIESILIYYEATQDLLPGIINYLTKVKKYSENQFSLMDNDFKKFIKNECQKKIKIATDDFIKEQNSVNKTLVNKFHYKF